MSLDPGRTLEDLEEFKSGIVPDNFGTPSMRLLLIDMTSDDIEAACAAVAADPAARLLSRPEALDFAPYDGARMFAFQGPAGERVELVERAWSPVAPAP